MRRERIHYRVALIAAHYGPRTIGADFAGMEYRFGKKEIPPAYARAAYGYRGLRRRDPPRSTPTNPLSQFLLRNRRPYGRHGRQECGARREPEKKESATGGRHGGSRCAATARAAVKNLEARREPEQKADSIRGL